MLGQLQRKKHSLEDGQKLEKEAQQPREDNQEQRNAAMTAARHGEGQDLRHSRVLEVPGHEMRGAAEFSVS